MEEGLRLNMNKKAERKNTEHIAREQALILRLALQLRIFVNQRKIALFFVFLLFSYLILSFLQEVNCQFFKLIQYG